MRQLLATEGAGIAIGISVFFILVGLLMKRVFVNILKQDAQASNTPSATPETPHHD